LRTYFRIEGRDDARLIREKVTGRLLSLDRTLEPFLPAMLWLLDVTTDDPRWDRLDPPQRRQQILDGVKRLLLRESQNQPVVVVFEDLHWIDAETQALVDALIEALPATRVLMLVNYRPEYQHTWGSKTYYRQLRIDPLPATSAHQLLDSLLGSDPTVQPLKALLVQRTQGTPFFLEEGVRTLVETKVLLGDPGSYRLLKSLDAIEVPATVKALLAARIDRLRPEEKAVLQAAAVIGTDVPFEILQAIADIQSEELRRRLAQLQAAEFLYEIKIFPELEYTFKHALTHEVAYGSLVGDRRRTLHARIVEAIERLYADRLDEQMERLAHHAVRSEVADKAVPYLYEAGTRAAQRSANGEAITYLRHGLDLASRLPPDRARMRHELRLLLALGPALQQVQGFGADEVETTYTRARELCEQVGEPVELFQTLWGLWLYTVGGKARFSEGPRIAQELLDLAERQGDPALLLEARHALSPTTLFVGEPAAALYHAEQGMALYDQEQHRSLAFLYGGHDPGVCCHMHSALALWMLGYPRAALDRGRRGVTLARALAHPTSIANALPFLGVVQQLRGEVEEVHEVADSMMELAAAHSLPQWLAVGRILSGWVQAERGHGVAQLQSAVADYHSKAKFDFWDLYFLALVAAACLKHGAIDDGLRAVMDALKGADQTGSQIYNAEFHRLRGELLLARDPADASQAEASFKQALAVAGNQNAKSWELRAALSLSRLWRRQGKRDEAGRLLRGVHDWFTEGFETADLREAKMVLDEPAVD
jgi:predicted ATPase